MTDETQAANNRSSRRGRGQAQPSGGRQSDGMKLLSAILRDGSTETLRDLDERWFTEEETGAFAFIDNHYRRYQHLPTQDALRESGINMPVSLDPVAYHLERCENRAIYNVVRENHDAYQQALKANDMSAVVGIMRNMITQSGSLQTNRDLASMTQESEDCLREFQRDKFRTGLKGITTGFEPVDEHTNGMQGGDVGILVGRPNMGKTYLLLKMVIEAWLSGKSILFVSMEMMTQQIIKRMIAMLAGINPYYVQRGKLSYHTETQMRDTIRGFAELPPIHFVAGKFRKTVADIDGYVLETNPDIIYIDGGYLVGSNRSQGKSSKNEKLTDVIEDIKEMAVNRNRPVITTVQFNREVRKNTKADLDLAQIAGTDAIGQIDSLVLGIRQGPRGNRTRQRIVEMLKNREGELVKFATDFRFDPPSFGYLGLYEDEHVKQEADNAQFADQLRQDMM